ncbi:hypothetical protein H4Q26_015757 [Puccinia striiformis f. sp. tritici PST-130]|nr:hypothetical protein H4Q26_015757 [Puccinia striiformis f. sp. tritici PST-130]
MCSSAAGGDETPASGVGFTATICLPNYNYRLAVTFSQTTPLQPNQPNTFSIVKSEARQSTPPNQTPLGPGPRQSSRIRTPLERPGFIQTHANSRRALQVIVSPSMTGRPSNPPHSQVNVRPGSHTQSAITTADAPVVGGIVVNLDQDSDDKNAKAAKKVKAVKGGFDNPKLYFFDGSPAPNQKNGLTYKCRWCPKSVRVPLSSISNLKTHRDGSIVQTGVRKACPGRHQAIVDGGKFPPSADEEDSAAKKKQNATSTLTAFTQKGRFDNATLNKILAFWIIPQSLPWNRFSDYLLGVAIDYCNANADVCSRTWAATYAHKLYINLKGKVIQDIHVWVFLVGLSFPSNFYAHSLFQNSGSKISLVADVWTTKGNHKAFIGISCCYINQKWEYVMQHLALKYVSWHHNWRYLAAPFTNVLIKHGLHHKISLFLLCCNITWLDSADALLGDFKHHATNHPRCFCHVLALILGAVLRALKLKAPIEQPTTKPDYFSTLLTIAEEDEESIDKASNPLDEDIQEIDMCEDSEEVNPDDASDGAPSEEDDPPQNEAGGQFSSRSPGSDVNGRIGGTLVKVDYISCQVSSSAAKRAEAEGEKYDGLQLIPGYGI